VLSEDPWDAGSLYTSLSDGSASGSNILSNGYLCDDINGRVVVVHGEGGVRIACAVISDDIPADNCFSLFSDEEKEDEQDENEDTPFVDNGPDDDDKFNEDSPFYNGPDEDDEFNNTPVDPTMSPITKQKAPDHDDDYYAHNQDHDDILRMKTRIPRNLPCPKECFNHPSQHLPTPTHKLQKKKPLPLKTRPLTLSITKKRNWIKKVRGPFITVIDPENNFVRFNMRQSFISITYTFLR